MISPSSGAWESLMYVSLLFSMLFTGDMCCLCIPCGFQAQMVLPGPSKFYLFKDNVGLNKPFGQDIS